MRICIYMILLLLFSVGCNPETVPETQAASPVPLPTIAETPFFVPGSERPVFPHGTDADWFAGAVEPGAIILYKGQYHLFFNGFNGWPAHSAVGHAISDDGIAWSMPSNAPLLDSADLEIPGFTFFVSSVLQLGDEHWAMYLYTLREGRDGAPGVILLARASRPEGPWVLEAEPILVPGDAGAWDGSRVTQPHVLRVADGYRMYFAGYENDRLRGGRRIGMAMSKDGLTWEKYAQPVFSFSEDARDWDAFRVFQPRVVETPDGFLMLYKSNISVGRSEALGFAQSADGLLWTRVDRNPVIDEKTYPVDWRRSGIAELLNVDGTLVLYLEILERYGGGYHHGNADYRSNIFRFLSDSLP